MVGQLRFSRHVRQWVLAAAVMGAAGAALPLFGANTVATWSGGTTGNWSLPGNWSTSDGAVLPPNTSTTDAVITSANSTVTLDSGFSVGSLTLGGTDALNFNLNTTLTLTGPTISNAGQITITAGSNTNSSLTLDGNTTLSGGGTITLAFNNSGSGTAFLQQGVTGVTLTNVDNTIQGTGVIGAGALGVSNAGIIDGNSTLGSLLLNSSTTMTNTNLLEATGGGTLIISTTVNNAGGSITSLGAGSVVNITGTIQGGTLNSASTGVLETTGTAILDGLTQGSLALSSSSTYTGNIGTATHFLGTITNNGNFVFTSGNNSNTLINLDANTTLQGGGTVTLAFNGSGGGETILQESTSGLTLTNTDNTIQGQGLIGNSGLSFSNAGTVNANISGGILTLNGGGGVTNTSLLEATGGGILQISTVIKNAGGNITSTGAGSTVNVSSTIEGGTLNTASSGVMQTSGTAVLDGKTQSTLTLSSSSTYNGPIGTTTDFLGTINNKGTFVFTGGNNSNSFLVLNDNTSFQGGGTITLTYNGSGSGQAIVQGSGLTLTNVDNTIQGQGAIGTTMTLVNQANGTIDANTSIGGATLLLDPASVTNAGLIESSSTGTLQIQTTIVNNGNITANGGTIQISASAKIEGGTLTNNGGTLGTPQSATAILDGSTNGALTLNGTYSGTFNSTTEIQGTINNKGTFLFTSGNNLSTFLVLNANTTLQGGGTVTLTYNNSGSGQAIVQGSGLTLTNVDNTIQGQGNIGSTMTLVNQANGTIDANTSIGGGSLLLNLGSVTNAGLIESSSTGTLVIQTTIVNNGNITANGGTIQFSGSATIEGGTLTNNGGTMGTPQSASATLDGSTNGALTLNGTYSADINSTTNILGTITNHGDIHVLAGSNLNPLLSVTGNTTLNGGGTVTLAYSGSGSGQAFVEQSTGTLTLTNFDNTIQGVGIIGNGGLTLINDAGGTINGNAASGPLILNPAGGVTNSGLMEATAGGTLQISGITVVNNNTITANGGTVQIVGTSRIEGGTLNNISGTLGTPNSATALLDGTTNGALTIKGTYFSDLSSTTELFGTITNQGTIRLLAGSNVNTLLDLNVVTPNTTVTLNGGGTVSMEYNGSGSGQAFIQQVVGGITLINVDNTIQGSGIIGNGALAFNNEGTVNANDSTGRTLLLNGGLITNTHMLEATNGGVLTINTTVNNAGGTITSNGAVGGATVNIQSATIQGGTLTSTNGGLLQTTGSSFLDGQTQGTLTITSGSTYVSNIATDTVLLGTINNQGTIHLISGSNQNTFLTFNANTTLQGGGTVTLDYNGSGSGQVFVQQNIGGLTLTNVDNTIQGLGTIGNGVLTVVNQAAGTINGNVSGQTLLLNASGGVSNLGTFEAANGGTLNVTADVAQDDIATAGTLTAGTYEVLTNSSLLIPTPGLPIVTIGNNASVILSGSGSLFSSGGVSIDATLTTNNGQLHVLNRTFNALPFTNNGLLQLGGAGSLPTGGGVFNAAVLINTGTIEATGTGNVLTIAAGITDPGSPTIQIDANSTLDIASGGINNETGNLVHNGTSLTIGNNSIFVTNSYTNANFGTGNSFNKHANVTAGTGQIISASTGITPVNNVTVSTSSVAFGNVHVSSNYSLNYQISNGTGGAVGPAVLFALQTSVNGGNITDPSLSGAGVTASNVGPVAINNNSGPLVVNYNPTVDGPLTGQTVHIANNFDNITESNVAVTGTAYNLAAPGAVVQSTYNLGPVHVGTTLTVNPTFSNSAPADGFSETLLVNIASHDANGYTTPSSTNGSVAPNSSHGGFVSVGLDTTAAQLGRSGSVTFQYQSDGTGANGGVNDGLGITTLGTATVTITADVLNYAVADLEKKSGDGSLSVNNPTTYTLDFGTITPGEAVSAALAVLNNVAGPADTLSGSFTTNAPNFTLGGLGAFSGIVAGGEQDGLTVGIDTNTPGLYNEFITLTPSSDDSAGDTPLGVITLDLVANVQGQSVPEPASLMVLGLGSAGLLLRRRRRM